MDRSNVGLLVKWIMNWISISQKCKALRSIPHPTKLRRGSLLWANTKPTLTSVEGDKNSQKEVMSDIGKSKMVEMETELRACNCSLS